MSGDNPAPTPSASGRVQLVGGPLDGCDVARPAGKFAWVRGKLSLLTRSKWDPSLPPALRSPVTVTAGAATGKPTTGAALYEYGEGLDGQPVALYAGHRRRFCNGCGAYHVAAEGGSETLRCPLEGEEVPRDR